MLVARKDPGTRPGLPGARPSRRSYCPPRRGARHAARAGCPLVLHAPQLSASASGGGGRGELWSPLFSCPFLIAASMSSWDASGLRPCPPRALSTLTPSALYHSAHFRRLRGRPRRSPQAPPARCPCAPSPAPSAPPYRRHPDHARLGPHFFYGLIKLLVRDCLVTMPPYGVRVFAHKVNPTWQEVD